MTDPTWWQWALVISVYVGIYLMIGIGKGWLMRAIQITIVMAVVLSNAYWPWTGSPYLPGLFGLGLAWLVTVFPVMLFTWPIFDQSPSNDPRLRRRAPAEKQPRRWGTLMGRRSASDSTLPDPGVCGGEESVGDGAGQGATHGTRSSLDAPHKRLTSRALGREDAN